MARAKRHYIPGYIKHIEKVNALLGFKVEGREVVEGDQGYQVREGSVPEKALLGDENDDVGLENIFFWDIKLE